MGWVKDALKELSSGKAAKVGPQGGSMRGRIESGQLLTIAPVEPYEIKIDDVVFVKWKGNYILHLVKDIQGDNILIGNNLGKENGWATLDDVAARSRRYQTEWSHGAHLFRRGSDKISISLYRELFSLHRQGRLMQRSAIFIGFA